MLDSAIDLPPDVADAIDQAAPKLPQEILNDLARTIAARKDEAVKGRQQSGIELTWKECEEAYLGIDDENRTEFGGAKWIKSMSTDGPLTTNRGNSSDDVRATAFVRMTSRYVDAAAAKIGEITLPIDGKAFSLKATPVPELVRALDDQSQAVVNGQPLTKPGPDGAPQPLAVNELARHVRSKADDAAAKAERRVWDWMVEYGHPREMRKVQFDMARLGVGILTGPEPEERKTRVVTKRPEGGYALEFKTEIKPAARWLDVWNFYPDPACGEDIHKGEYVFEHDRLSGWSLLRLKDLDPAAGWLADAIESVVKEGPTKAHTAAGNPADETMTTQVQRRALFDVWHQWGWVSIEELKAANQAQAQDIDPKAKRVAVICTLVNDTIIRVTPNPAEGGKFPQKVGIWRRRAGHWAGVGIAEQIRMPQRLVNSATRSAINNAAKSGGSILVTLKGALEPANGQNTLTPDKLYYATPEVMDDVRKIFATFNIPNVTPQLMTIIDYAFKLAEESTNIPLITQGLSGDTSPDTFGATRIQDNNATQLLRDVGYHLAESVSNPMVNDLYEWLLLDPDVPDDEKGDHQVDTNSAFSAIERSLQDQTIAQLAQFVSNPAFGINQRRWLEVYLRSKRLNPADIQNTEDEQAKIDAMPPPQPIPVQVAQINAAQRDKATQANAMLTEKKIAVDTDRDTAYTQSLSERANLVHQATLQELQVRERLAMLDYANKHQITLDQLKAELAQTAMKLNVQQALSTEALAADMHKHHNPNTPPVAPNVITPPTEPAGRAPNGQGFEA